MYTHRNDLLPLHRICSFTSGPRKAGNKHNKKMLPSVPSADPASGSRSRRFHRPTLISDIQPFSSSFLFFADSSVSVQPPFQSSSSFQLWPKVNFRELPSGARITGLLSVNPLPPLQGLSLSKWTASKAAIRSNLWNGDVLGRQNPRRSIVRWVADSTPTNGREAFRVEDRKFWYWYLDLRSRPPILFPTKNFSLPYVGIHHVGCCYCFGKFEVIFEAWPRL